jgi:pyochelin biosynthesis protein PchC
VTALLGSTVTWLRRFRPVDAPWTRLVCFPHAGGSAAAYRTWRTDVPPDVELYAVQYPGRLDRIGEPCVDDMDRVADAVTDAITPLLDRPVALFGHSLGAAIAYETARRLPARTGHVPARLFVSGRPAPDRQRPGSTHLATDDVLWDEVRRLGGTGTDALADPELREAFLPALRSDYRLAETYRPRPGPPLDCPITALLGDRDSEVNADEASGWARFTRAAFSIRVFPGDHFYLVTHHAQVVDEVIDRLADRSTVRQPGPAARQPGWAGP